MIEIYPLVSLDPGKERVCTTRLHGKIQQSVWPVLDSLTTLVRKARRIINITVCVDSVPLRGNHILSFSERKMETSHLLIIVFDK